MHNSFSKDGVLIVRKAISKTGIGSSDAEMRSFRDMMIKSDKKYYNKIFKYDKTHQNQILRIFANIDFSLSLLKIFTINIK